MNNDIRIIGLNLSMCDTNTIFIHRHIQLQHLHMYVCVRKAERFKILFPLFHVLCYFDFLRRTLFLSYSIYRVTGSLNETLDPLMSHLHSSADN